MRTNWPLALKIRSSVTSYEQEKLISNTKQKQTKRLMYAVGCWARYKLEQWHRTFDRSTAIRVGSRTATVVDIGAAAGAGAGVVAVVVSGGRCWLL